MPDQSSITNHKFVNTTPKPNATKNSNGELVGPPPPWFVMVGVGAGTVVETDCDCAAVGSGVVWVPPRFRATKSLCRTWSTSTISSLTTILPVTLYGRLVRVVRLLARFTAKRKDG
jgi:hypothetical protein